MPQTTQQTPPTIEIPEVPSPELIAEIFWDGDQQMMRGHAHLFNMQVAMWATIVKHFKDKK